MGLSNGLTFKSAEKLRDILNRVQLSCVSGDPSLDAEIVVVWADAMSIAIARSLTLHVAHHDCKAAPALLNTILDVIRDVALDEVKQCCDATGLKNPFEEKTHNQKVSDEIISELQKESQNG